MRRPVRPGAPQCELDLAVVDEFEAIVCHGRPQRIAGDALSPVWLIRGHAEPGMEIEAVTTRVARAEPRRIGRGSGLAAAANASTGPRTERGPPLH